MDECGCNLCRWWEARRAFERRVAALAGYDERCRAAHCADGHWRRVQHEAPLRIQQEATETTEVHSLRSLCLLLFKRWRARRKEVAMDTS